MIRVLSMLFLHFACSFILQAKIGDAQTVFRSDMFPYLDNYTSINSSAIEINWHPSPVIAGIDLTELVGAFTMAAYATSRTHISIHRATYAMTALNETGKLILTDLKPNTIYSVRFEREWQGSNTNRIIVRDIGSKLIRTYTNDETTLNPVPHVGEHNWKQIVNSAGKTAVLVNASISLELPYRQRNITVTFGSENQSSALSSSMEFATFQFDQLDSQSKDYLLKVAFTVVAETGSSLYGNQTTTITRSETVRITPTTNPNGTGSRFNLVYTYYLVLLTMLFFK